MAPHPIHLPVRANDNRRPLPAGDREQRANLSLIRADGPWLVGEAPRAPVLNMALAAAGARLAASWR